MSKRARNQQKQTAKIIGLIAIKDNEAKGNDFILRPIDKKNKKTFPVSKEHIKTAKPGDIITGEFIHGKVHVTKIIGHQNDSKTISLVAAHEKDLRTVFSQAVLDETKGMTVPPLSNDNREDLRNIPLVTIDGADARDFDDAVFAKKTKDGGFDLIVSIADVAHYVRPNSALDKEAYLRGNSTYFPDMVLPMLPETLSNGLCSLKPNVERACVAVHMHIDKEGTLKTYKFSRALMKSKARLTYEQVQHAKDGKQDTLTAPLMNDVINPLYEAFDILLKARKERGTMDFDLPETKVLVDDEGNMTGIKSPERLDSHRLIEEFMILANVSAASELENKNKPCVYRIHPKPPIERLEKLRAFLGGIKGITMPDGEDITPKELNEVLAQAAELPSKEAINKAVLRTQSRSSYNPVNEGHYGLALERYAHFTSPIRRYADLLVHRSLTGDLTKQDAPLLEEKTTYISKTERLSAQAERKAVSRLVAAFLAAQKGKEFEGTISSVHPFGLFVRLKDTNTDGFIPMRLLPGKKYNHDVDNKALVEQEGNRVFRTGASITVRVKEANPLTGETLMEPANDKGADIPGFEKPAKRQKNEI